MIWRSFAVKAANGAEAIAAVEGAIEAEEIAAPSVKKIGVVREMRALPMEGGNSMWAVTVKYEVDNGIRT